MNIREYVLLNAAQHNGKADAKAVLGKYLADNPSEKKNIKKLMADIKMIVSAVDKLSLEKQKGEMEKLGLKIEKKVEAEKELPELPEVKGKVVMRFAPNPDGPLSLGRARQALLNWFYTRKYKGEYVLRFDDTDPKVKTPLKEAYDWIIEDLKWLGVSPDTVAKASDRLKIYYKYADELIKMGRAYVCTCSAEEFRELRNKKQACPCRNMEVEEQIIRWHEFFKTFKEGEAVVRIKTDIKHPNPAMRDWPALRIVDNPQHPLSKEKVWPLYDFASAIDDHEFGITHIIRGRDFELSEEKQGWIYRFFNWPYPVNIVTGKLVIQGIKSTSVARKAIEAGEIAGWDDPRLPTLMAFRKRGFEPEAIQQFIKAAGLTKGDVQVSLENFESINRKIIDFKADRYFFVPNPIEMEIDGAEKQTAKLLLHPDEPKRGERILHFNKTVLISKDDLNLLKDGQEFRLKDLFNVKIKSLGKASFTSKELKKGLQIIQWLPLEEKVPLTLVMPDASERKGFAEPACKDFHDKLVQFERVGFAVVSKINKELLAYYTHR